MLPSYRAQVSDTEVEMEVICFNCRIRDIIRGEINKHYTTVGGWTIVHLYVVHVPSQTREVFAFFCNGCSQLATPEHVVANINCGPVGVI